MRYFDTMIRGGFGNTPKILEEAHKDLAADNAAAAKAEYGRGITMVSVPLLALDRLLGAGDHLYALANGESAKTTWMIQAGAIRMLINEHYK